MLDIEITKTLYNLAGYHFARGEKYRARAFERAAMNLDGFGHFIDECVKKHQLETIPGIGPSILKIVDEIRETGGFKPKDGRPLFSEPFWAQISKISHCGVRVLQKIYEGDISTFYELEHALHSSDLNLTRSSEAALLKFIRESNPLNDDYIGIPFPIAFMISQEIINDLKFLKLKVCGEVRMLSPRVRQIEFLTTKTNIALICRAIGEHRYSQKSVEVIDKSVNTILFPRIKCSIHTSPPELETFSLFIKSSPLEHIKELSSLAKYKGINLSKNGISRNKRNIASELKSEQEIYKLLDLTFIPPELRHFPIKITKDLDESLISLDSVHGEFHVHTAWSDGLDSLDKMALKAVSMGYDYLGIADHSEVLKVANGLTINELMTQLEEIDKFNSNSNRFRILKGSEVDILSNGEIDYPPELLSKLDFVIAAIHTGTHISQHKMTNRILRAVENPFVNILAHPAGSLTSRPGNFFTVRNPWGMDFKRIASACAKNHVALEINAFPERMDLSAEYVRIALKQGAKIVINTDAHSSYHLNLLEYGIMLARRGGCKRSDILNTLPWSEAKKYFSQKSKQNLIDINEASKLTSSMFSRQLDSYSLNTIFSGLSIDNRIPIVVGIDLTSSQNRESGWAVLRGAQARTLRLKSDQDLIDATLDVVADIVSIDSPLSLPYGRCCTKPECKCYSFGIIRFCERFLMANRIGVFPCLLPSMLELTKRGIRLKKLFERKGLRVIESYPGVAQDILGIPRKKRGNEKLYEGLLRFGLKFDKEYEYISHDELDAITSALVGYFYLSGQYLELGDERENFLIVPSIQSFRLSHSGQCVIAITGFMGAGKTTSALYLALKYGFKYMRYSRVIAKLAGYNGKYDKTLLQEAGLDLHKKIGQKEINMMLLADMPKDKHVVVDGMRFIEDLNILREKFGSRFFPIVIESKHSLIKKKLRKSSFFADKSENEINNILSHEVENQIYELSFQIPYKLRNDGSFKELFEQIDQYLKKLMQKEGN